MFYRQDAFILSVILIAKIVFLKNSEKISETLIYYLEIFISNSDNSKKNIRDSEYPENFTIFL